MFSNRVDAGMRLAKILVPMPNSLVLAIPRGGVVLGDIIAQKIGCPLDVVISKKITPPDYPEYAIGAITHDGTLYQGEHWSKFSQDPRFAKELSEKQTEVKERLEKYRGNAEYVIKDKQIILVDDGVATGATVLAILEWIKNQHPKKITLVLPVIPRESFNKLEKVVDEIISLEISDSFTSVGQFYEDFSQIPDKKVQEILAKYN